MDLDNTINVDDNTNDSAHLTENIDIILELIDLVKELDYYASQIDNENGKNVVSYCQNRIIESILKHNSFVAISADTEYNTLWHTTRPYSSVQEGTIIKDIIRTGIIYHGKVILKAIVKV